MFVVRSISLTQRQCNEGLNPFSFSLTLGNPSRAIGGKASGILGNH